MDIRIKWYYRLGFLLLLFVVLFIFFKLQHVWSPIIKIVFTVLFPFIVSAFITYLLHPIVEMLHNANLPRWLAVMIIYLLFFGGVGTAIYKGIPEVIVQLRELTENAPYVSDQYREWISTVQLKTSTWPDVVQERIDEGIVALELGLESLLSRVLDILVNILNSFVIFAVIPFIVFYMLKDIELIKMAGWYMTPKSWRREVILYLRDVDKSLGSYIRGQLCVCSIIGTLSAFLFWIVGMKYPLLLGVIVGTTNIIPYFGPIIGAIPAVILAATISSKLILYCVIIILVLQFLEGNVLSPLIVGKSLHMHPLLIMFALLAGGEFRGILGLILAVPILAVLKVSIIHARNHFIKSKNSIESIREH